MARKSRSRLSKKVLFELDPIFALLYCLLVPQQLPYCLVMLCRICSLRTHCRFSARRHHVTSYHRRGSEYPSHSTLFCSQRQETIQWEVSSKFAVTPRYEVSITVELFLDKCSTSVFLWLAQSNLRWQYWWLLEQVHMIFPRRVSGTPSAHQVAFSMFQTLGCCLFGANFPYRNRNVCAPCVAHRVCASNWRKNTANASDSIGECGRSLALIKKGTKEAQAYGTA